MSSSIPSPGVFGELARIFTSRQAVVLGDAQLVRSAYSSPAWVGPRHDEFGGTQLASLLSALSNIQETLGTLASQSYALEQAFEEELQYLIRLEQEVRNWLDDCYRDLLSDVSHVVGAVMDASEHFLGIRTEDLPQTGSPLWRSEVLPRAVARGFVA